MDADFYVIEQHADAATRTARLVDTIVVLAAHGAWAVNVDVLGTYYYAAFVVGPVGGRGELVSNENIETRRHRLDPMQEVRLSGTGWQPSHPDTRNWWMAWTGAERPQIEAVVTRAVAAIVEVYDTRPNARWQVEWIDIAGAAG